MSLRIRTDDQGFAVALVVDNGVTIAHLLDAFCRFPRDEIGMVMVEVEGMSDTYQVGTFQDEPVYLTMVGRGCVLGCATWSERDILGTGQSHVPNGRFMVTQAPAEMTWFHLIDAINDDLARR